MIADAEVYLTLDEAIRAVDDWDSPIHSIRHIVKYNGGFVIMGHINCESCLYCIQKCNALNTKHCCSGPHEYIENIYSTVE